MFLFISRFQREKIWRTKLKRLNVPKSGLSRNSNPLKKIDDAQIDRDSHSVWLHFNNHFSSTWKNSCPSVPTSCCETGLDIQQGIFPHFIINVNAFCHTRGKLGGTFFWYLARYYGCIRDGGCYLKPQVCQHLPRPVHASPPPGMDPPPPKAGTPYPIPTPPRQMRCWGTEGRYGWGEEGIERLVRKI